MPEMKAGNSANDALVLACILKLTFFFKIQYFLSVEKC